mmetsp:Transcript_25831/g.63901  ORF Transcript_25831/g.63901 Transcript_25831/m.63901 type:complete len:85 (+) Transcript_25831:608-862(+)
MCDEFRWHWGVHLSVTGCTNPSAINYLNVSAVDEGPSMIIEVTKATCPHRQPSVNCVSVITATYTWLQSESGCKLPRYYASENW